MHGFAYYLTGRTFADGYRDRCTEANIECAADLYSTFVSLQDGEGFISLESFASATAYVEQTYVPRRSDDRYPAGLEGTLIGRVYKACVGGRYVTNQYMSQETEMLYTVCIYTYTYIHTYIHAYMSIRINVCTHIHTYIHTYIHTHTHIHTRMDTYIDAYTYMHIHILPPRGRGHKRMHINARAYIYAWLHFQGYE
jgi:hypothetical protein